MAYMSSGVFLDIKSSAKSNLMLSHKKTIQATFSMYIMSGHFS